MARTVWWIATFCAFAAQVPAATSSHVRGFALGGEWSYSLRRGYLEIDGLQQDTARRPLSLWGIWGGPRYAIAPWLWLQVTGELSYGVNELTTDSGVQLEDGTTRDLVSETEEMTVFSAVPSLCYLLPAVQRFEPYLVIGVGIDYVHYQEIGRTLPGFSFFRESIGLPDANQSRLLRIDARGGAGIEVGLTPKIAIDIGYVFRYWSPVSCVFRRDLPLHGVKYRETFRTHHVRLGLVWGW